MAVISSLLLSCSLFKLSFGIGTDDSLGCNHYGRDYAPDVCYPEDVWTDPESEMYKCDNGTMYRYTWDNYNCEGNATSTFSYSWSGYDDDYYCNAASSCSYFIMYKYEDNTNCVGDPIDAETTGLANICVNNTGGIWGDSYYYECNTDGWYEQRYYENDDCSGSVNVDFGPYDAEFYDSFYTGDYRLYCSDTMYWSECNEDAAITIMSSFNIKLLSIFTVVIVAIVNKL